MNFEKSKISAENLESAKVLVREGIRRYNLPLGVAGKHKTYKKNYDLRNLSQPNILVIQEIAILIPPEYIYGLFPNDCLSLNFHLQYFEESLGQIEYLCSYINPSLIIISLPIEKFENKNQFLEFYKKLKKLPWVKSHLNCFCDIQIYTVNQTKKEVCILDVEEKRS